jgi:hypothetical protein
MVNIWSSGELGATPGTQLRRTRNRLRSATLRQLAEPMRTKVSNSEKRLVTIVPSNVN